LSRELKRWQAILLATGIVVLPILSCSQHSLVLVTVNAPPGATAYSNVSLIITANGQETTTFNKASFTGGAYKAGVYLPSDMSGPVPFTAEVVQDGCQIATGGPVVSPDVSSGATVSLTNSRATSRRWTVWARSMMWIPLRSAKMNGFIFGFQRRVWWPKWTPASSSWRMETDGTGATSCRFSSSADLVAGGRWALALPAPSRSERSACVLRAFWRGRL